MIKKFKCLFGFHSDIEAKTYPIKIWMVGEPDKFREDTLFLDRCTVCGHKEAYTLSTYGRTRISMEYVNKKMKV
jgi:hypothetical protein